MTEPMVYVADARAFLERAGRTEKLLAEITAGSFDPVDWSRRMESVILEVDEIPFVVGARYRIRTLGGDVSIRHLHLRDQDTGDELVLDVPTAVDQQYVEIEGTFVGRRAVNRHTTFYLDVAGRGLALMTDSDVLRAEEIR